MSYLEAMREKGFSYSTTASVTKLECPVCGFRFSLVYARAVACRGCPDAYTGCRKVRCARCDAEFPLPASDVSRGTVDQRALADHICSIVNEHYASEGLVSAGR